VIGLQSCFWQCLFGLLAGDTARVAMLMHVCMDLLFPMRCLSSDNGTSAPAPANNSAFRQSLCYLLLQGHGHQLMGPVSQGQEVPLHLQQQQCHQRQWHQPQQAAHQQELHLLLRQEACKLWRLHGANCRLVLHEMCSLQFTSSRQNKQWAFVTHVALVGMHYCTVGLSDEALNITLAVCLLCFS